MSGDINGLGAMPTARATHEPSQQVVSAVPVGVTIAVARLIAALKPWEDDWAEAKMPASVPDDKLMLDADCGGEIITVGHWRELMAALVAARSPSPCSVENGGWLGPTLSKRIAQVGTRPQGQDGEAGLGRSPSDAVGNADAPEPQTHTTKGI